jgi:hypothetical protein
MVVIDAEVNDRTPRAKALLAGVYQVGVNAIDVARIRVDVSVYCVRFFDLLNVGIALQGLQGRIA